MLRLANELKTKGNEEFKNKKYQEAIKFYEKGMLYLPQVRIKKKQT